MKLLLSKKKERRKIDISIIWWILVPYAALFLCFVFLMSYLLHFSSDKLQKEMHTAHYNTSGVITSHIQSIKHGFDSFVLQMTNDKELLSIGEKYSWNDSDVYYNIHVLNSDLGGALLPYNSVQSISIYYPRTDKIVTQGNILSAKRDFKSYTFSTKAADVESYSSWKDFMLAPHGFEMYANEKGEFYYIHSITKQDETIAVFIIDVNEACLKNLLTDNSQSSGFIIYNHLKEPVFFYARGMTENPFENYTPDFTKHTATFEKDSASYVYFFDNSVSRLGVSYFMKETELYKPAKDLTSYFLLLIIIFLSISACIIFYFTRIHYRSVSDITETLKTISPDHTDSRRKRNEYAFIKDSVKSLSRKLAVNESILNKQNKISLISILKKNLTSHYQTMEISKLFDVYKVDFTFSNYVVALVTISFTNEDYWSLPRGDDELILTATENVFCDYAGSEYQTLTVQLEESSFLMLIGTNCNSKEEISNNIEKIFIDTKTFCAENLYFDFYAHISDISTDINNIKSMYEKLHSSYYINPENAVLSQKQISTNHSFDYEVLESIEIALQNKLENSDFAGIEQLLDSLFTEQFNMIPHNFLTGINCKLLNIFFDLTKKLEPDKVQDYLNLLSRINPQQASYKDFINLADYYCKVNSAANNTDNIRLAVAITEYVNKHFADVSLNVNTISYNMKRNPSYVSSLFKSETGKLLNQYISETRLHHAKLLLLTDKKIDQVAEECGFSDVATFRRIFKKYIGVTPSEYRKGKLN